MGILQSLLSLPLKVMKKTWMAKNRGRRPNNTRDWTMLPQDVLEVILARLDLADHIRFGSVCSDWRSVAAVENPPTNKSFAVVPSDGTDRLTLRLLSSLLPSWEEVRFIGSFEGWLVALIDGGREMLLLNPGSGERVPLPPPPDPMPFDYKAVLSSTPSSAGGCTVVLRQDVRILWFCRPGDESFTRFYPPEGKEGVPIFDLVFYKEQLYALEGSLEVKAFDSGLGSAPATLALPTAMCAPYLVVSGEKLLALGCGDSWCSPIHPHKALELDPSGSRWVGAGSFGGNVLLICYQTSQSFSARDHRQLRGDHVYYGDAGWDGWLRSHSLDGRADSDQGHRGFSRDEATSCRAFFNLFNPKGFKHVREDGTGDIST